MKKRTMSWETVRSLRGVTALARRIGYSHTHLLRVMRGERKAGPELLKKLRRLGIEVEAGSPAKEPAVTVTWLS